MLSRSVAARSNAVIFRRVATRRPAGACKRFQSTLPPSGGSSSKIDATHVAAGVAGGLSVALAGYAWYHMSGLRKVVQTTKEMKSYLQTTSNSVMSKARESAKNPSQALSHLRGIAKSYTFFVPGADQYVDGTFDELEDLYEMHSGEMDSILKETTEELLRETQKRRADTETARSVYNIVRNSVGRMKELGKKVGGDILDKNPTVKEKLGSSYEQLQSLAQKAGPEGKRALSEVRNQVKILISKGKADEGSIKKVDDLIQEKTSSLRKRAESSGHAAVSGDSEVLGELFKNVPDTEELFKKAPHVQELVNLAQDRSEDAKNLAKETVSDVLSVLEEKGKKAKELSERTKADAEKQAKN